MPSTTTGFDTDAELEALLRHWVDLTLRLEEWGDEDPTEYIQGYSQNLHRKIAILKQLQRERANVQNPMP